MVPTLLAISEIRYPYLIMKYPQKSLVSKIEREIKQNSLIVSGDNIVVALSGGPDSVCLFNLLFEIKDRLGIGLSVCHFNHQLRGAESDKDEALVRKICEGKNVACVVGRAGEEGMYKSEAEARVGRYAFFEKILEEGRGGKIALAHNLNDMAETVLFRFVRGTGLKGLRGIPRVREKFIRPLLPFSREEIESYIADNFLEYRIDQTNYDLKYQRNFIRARIIPLLTQINPNVTETLGLSARIIEDDYDLLRALAETECNNIIVEKSEKKIVLNRALWMKLHPSLKRMVLRHAISEIAGLFDITLKHLDEVSVMIREGRGGKFKSLPYSLRVETRNGTINIVSEENFKDNI